MESHKLSFVYRGSIFHFIKTEFYHLSKGKIGEHEQQKQGNDHEGQYDDGLLSVPALYPFFHAEGFFCFLHCLCTHRNTSIPFSLR